MSLTIDQIRVVHSAIVGDGEAPGSMIMGANVLLKALGEDMMLDREDHALELLRSYCKGLLEAENYEGAAALQWNEQMFDLRPKYGRQIFEFIPKHKKMLFCGSMSVSKTYSFIAWVLLDYLRDPQYTAVKMLSVNDEHMKANMFAHMLGLFRACAVPMLDEDDLVVSEASSYLGLRSAGSDMGIDGVATKQSKFGPGTIRGYKPKPYRKVAHPKFGNMTRLRIALDEGQQWSEAHFKDLRSPLASASGNDIVKVMIAFNPEDQTIPVVQLAEPEEGWNESQLETLYEWESKQGWNVLRLDGAKCENVVERRDIYAGLISWEAYLDNMKGGDNSAAYYVSNRGFPPIRNAVNTVIPGNWVNGCWGEATFIETPINLASTDLGYHGSDPAIMATAKWGLASGWRRRDGTYIVFKDRLNPGRSKPRMVLQIEQLMTMVKAEDTISVAEEILQKCKELGVKPEHSVLDKTGMGAGTWSHLSRYWGDVLGIQWGEKPTGLKLVSDDREGSDKLCDNNVTELFWCLRRWMDPTVGAVIINPSVPQNPLTTQLTYRRYWHLHGSKVRVESKEEYKARQKFSPNEADAIIMLPHLIRLRLGEFPGVTDITRDTSQSFGETVSHDDLDEPETLSYGDGPYASQLD